MTLEERDQRIHELDAQREALARQIQKLDADLAALPAVAEKWRGERRGGANVHRRTTPAGRTLADVAVADCGWRWWTVFSGGQETTLEAAKAAADANLTTNGVLLR